MVIYFIIFSLALLAIGYLLRVKITAFSGNRKALFTIVLIGLLGLTLAFFSGRRLQTEIARQAWPQVKARIVDSQVGGRRAYHPVIIYAYFFDGKEYRKSTSLESPGFGTKNARRDTATRIIAKFVPGDSISVFVNPQRPRESFIRIGPYWSDYLQVSTGLLLYGFGFVALSALLFTRKSTKKA